MYGDGDPYDGLAAVERRGRDQTVVGRLYHQLATAHLDNQDDIQMTMIALIMRGGGAIS